MDVNNGGLGGAGIMTVPQPTMVRVCPEETLAKEVVDMMLVSGVMIFLGC
jgi:hypothetical protein